MVRRRRYRVEEKARTKERGYKFVLAVILTDTGVKKEEVGGRRKS